MVDVRQPMDGRGLRIAMIGTRGVPATWGGVERHVEELGARLHERGHDVTVFSRLGYADPVEVHRGMRVVPVSTTQRKGLESLQHSFSSAARALRGDYDIVHFHAVGPGLAAPLPRLLSAAGVVQTIHGLDGARDKWGAGQQQVLRLGTWLSARLPDATVVVSRDLQAHYRSTYGRETTYIPNGVAVPSFRRDTSALARFGVRAGRYVLSVGRLVPEKAAHLLIEGFSQVETDARLIVVGNSSHTDEYVGRLQRLAAADPRVSLVGAVYGEELDNLYCHAAAFATPSLLEGLPLTLLEAASHCAPVVVSAIPPHLEVVGGDGPGARVAAVGSASAMRDALRRVLADPQGEADGARHRSERIMAEYDWDAATSGLEDVYARVSRQVSGRSSAPLAGRVLRRGAQRSAPEPVA